MTSSVSPWSPSKSSGLSPVLATEPCDQHAFLSAPLLSSSPVIQRHVQSVMNNSLDLENNESLSSQTSAENDSSFCSRKCQQQQLVCSKQALAAMFARLPMECCSYNGPAKQSCGVSYGQFLYYRTELLVSGQQATPWNHFTIVGQLRKLENLNLIDKSLIKQENPAIEILTLVQKLIKYNLAMELIDNEDEILRKDQLAKLIQLRCDEVLAISNSIQDITERRQAMYYERCRIKLAMKDVGTEIALKTHGGPLEMNNRTEKAMAIDNATAMGIDSPTLNHQGIKPLISL